MRDSSTLDRDLMPLVRFLTCPVTPHAYNEDTSHTGNTTQHMSLGQFIRLKQALAPPGISLHRQRHTCTRLYVQVATWESIVISSFSFYLSNMCANTWQVPIDAQVCANVCPWQPHGWSSVCKQVHIDAQCVRRRGPDLPLFQDSLTVRLLAKDIFLESWLLESLAVIWPCWPHPRCRSQLLLVSSIQTWGQSCCFW